MSQRLLQQCRSDASYSSVAATRAATSPQRSRDTCCNNAAALPRHELQHYNVTSLQCCNVASLQCCSNASLHRCSSTLPSPSPQSSQVRCGVVTSDVALPIFVRRTSVRWSYVLFILLSYVIRPTVMWSCVLRPTVLWSCACGPASCIIHNNS